MVDGESSLGEVVKKTDTSHGMEQSNSLQIESASSHPRLLQLEYKDPNLKETPEAKSLERIMGRLDTMKRYIRMQSMQIPESWEGLLPAPREALKRYEHEFKFVTGLLSAMLQGTPGVDDSRMPVNAEDMEGTIHRVLEEEGEDVNNIRPEEIKRVTIEDHATLAALNSPDILERFAHDVRTPFITTTLTLQMFRRRIEKMDFESADKNYASFRDSLLSASTGIDKQVENFVQPFSRKEYLPEEVANEFRNVSSIQFTNAKGEIGDIPDIAFETASLPDGASISLAPFLMVAISENTVSNFIKKVHAMRRQAEVAGTEFTAPKMSVAMKLEGDEFVMNIDDTGFGFGDEDINDPMGFEGMRERNKHGYGDTDIPSTGVGNANVAEILRTQYGATFKPAAVTDSEGKRLPGARVQFRMKYQPPPTS